MMYPFLTLPDGTEIVHSEAQMIDGKEQVKVYVWKSRVRADLNLPYAAFRSIDGRGFRGLTNRRWRKFVKLFRPPHIC